MDLEGPTPEYCQFCGQHLPDGPDPLYDHLREHEDCSLRYNAWNTESQSGQSSIRKHTSKWASAGRGIAVLLISGYSVIILQQILLAVLGGSFFYLASHVPTLVRAMDS